MILRFEHIKTYYQDIRYHAIISICSTEDLVQFVLMKIYPTLKGSVMKKSIIFVLLAVLAVAFGVDQTYSATTADPYRNYPVRVMMDGKLVMAFLAISGWDLSQNVVEYREGNEVVTPRKLPGLKKYANVTFKNGILISSSATGWLDSVSAGKPIVRKPLTITMLDANGAIASVWEMTNTLVVKVAKSSKLNTDGQQTFDSVECAHEGTIRTK
jgi:phage tail-like protein